ncbi:MAG: FMN-binding protein [Pirellulaceae bacterium]|nr:FMN-binding protein [Pirellulaceae bacterium]
MTARVKMISALIAILLLVGSVFLIPRSAQGQDTIEFLNGVKMQGVVKEIRNEKREFDFEVVIGGKTFLRTYAFHKVHAVTLKNKRHVVTAKKTATNSGGSGAADQELVRSRAEVQQAIASAGDNFPDWWDETKLEYPASLDLNWPLKPAGNWNSQRNIGQFIWDVVNPNPGRWNAGIKFVYERWQTQKNDSEKNQRNMIKLGIMFFNLKQDYARAAYWFERAGIQKGSGQSVKLAESYWRLGSKSMAIEMVTNRILPASVIKLHGDMGNYQSAVKLANSFKKGGSTNPLIDMFLGDALRHNGQISPAIAAYERVVSSTSFKNDNYEKKVKARARDSIEAIRLLSASNVTNVRDGAYRSASTGYVSAVEVEVQVASGRLTSVEVVHHSEKQFYSSIEDTTSQIMKRNSVQGIDGTTGATITSQAIINATAKALAKGAK